ncbi:MAG TPA: ATP-binding protein [Thermodesulfobacteriota bacterium]|nr:ATP-binding protein [Thermodesulfobacteriota bacterium]
MAKAGKTSEPRGRWIFRPVFLLITWALLALILVANGIYEAKRLRDNLNRVLSDQGAAVISGLEKNAQAIFSSWTALEAFPEASALLYASSPNPLALDDSVADLALEIAFQIDDQIGKDTPDENRIGQIARAFHLSGLMLVTPQDRLAFHNPRTARGEDFYRPVLEGKAAYALERSENKGTGQMESLSLAVARKAGAGVIVLQADAPDLRLLRRRVVLQGLLDDWKEKGEIRFITLQGEDMEIWADTLPAKIGKKEEDPFLLKILLRGDRHGGAEFRRSEGVLEVAKTAFLDQKTLALIRVGISTERADEIFEADLRHILLFGLLLLASGGLGIVAISRSENRHLARVREMEEKVRQSEKLSSLANLAAGVAHEIRNPLNAIGMAIQRLQREFEPAEKDRKEYRDFTDVLRGEVDRVNRIIEQFLFFARPARLDLKPVELGGVLKNLVLLCKEEAERNQVRIAEKVGLDLPLLDLDRERIHEALWNIVRNAMQAMPRGGELRIAAAAVRAKSRVEIEIADTGEGISPENLGRIFDYYFTTKEGGMGLGLPLAHKIVEGHGGSIEVDSVPGKGTSFRIMLPIPGGKREPKL